MIGAANHGEGNVMDSFVCVTGAAGSLGKALAVECAYRGWSLFLTDISADSLDALAAGLRAAYGARVETYPCDMTDEDSRDRLFAYMEERGFRFWGLINVAGIDYEGPFLERRRVEIRTILRLNIEGTLEITHAVLRRRDAARRFRLITVGSLASFYPMPRKAAYAASKRFLLDFFMALREEIRGIGTVTILCPAGMPTTPACIRKIGSQGLMGRVTTCDVGFVAVRVIEEALKGRCVYIPGVSNRLLRFAGSLVPRPLLAWVVGMRWKAAARKESVIESRGASPSLT
jgi:short-subunit dehydrogenase